MTFSMRCVIWHDHVDSPLHRLAPLTFQNTLQTHQVLGAMTERFYVGWTFMSVARP